MKLKKIQSERRRVSDEVYEQILDAIHNNDITESDRLVQEKLAAELQISRTPVREALLRLEQEGILVTSPRGGFVIHRLSEDEVSELYQARAAVEAQAARILANLNDPEKNASLRQKIEQEEATVKPTIKAYFKANRNIHRAIVELCDNRYLLEMFDNIWNRSTSFSVFATLEKVDITRSLGGHLNLIEAIETGDPCRAMETLIAHINEGLDLQIKALKR